MVNSKNVLKKKFKIEKQFLKRQQQKRFKIASVSENTFNLNFNFSLGVGATEMADDSKLQSRITLLREK